MQRPILLEIPMPITTPRLLLCPPQPGDGAEIHAAIAESFEELHPWMPWADKMPTIEDSEENVRRACANWILRQDMRISIFDRATGKLAGSTGLHKINWDIPSFEIGYWVRKCFQGTGYASESTNALTRYAFRQLKAKRVELRCNAENVRSLAVFKKLAFEREGCLRNYDAHANASVENRDTLVYARISLDGLPSLEVTW